MSKNLSHLDILGINPILFSNSSKRKKTKFGGLMSILTVIICFAGVLYFSLDVFRRSSYIVIYNQSTDLNPILNLTEIPYAFTIVDGEGKHIKNFENQIRVYAEYVTINPDNDTSEIVVIKRNHFKLDKCNFDDFGDYKSLYMNFPKINQLFCLPINKLNLTLYGTFADAKNPNTVINIRITKCFNDPKNTELFPEVDCYNRSFVDKNLANIFFSSVNPEYDIDHSNPNNPGKLILRTDTLPLSSTIFNRYYMYQRIINYISDFGIFISSSETKKFFQQDLITHMTDLRVESDQYGLFGLITISLSKKTDFYWRNYVKLQTALANIGGIVEGIFFIFSILVRLVMSRNYFSELGIYAFTSNQKEEKEIKYKKLPNESSLSQIDICQNNIIRKQSHFKYIKKSFTEIKSNMKKSERENANNQSSLKFHQIYEDLNKNSKNVLDIYQNNSIKKNKLNEEAKTAIIKIIPKRNNSDISKKFEKIIKRELSVENILKNLNLIEIIEKDLLDKQILDINSLHKQSENLLVIFEKKNEEILNINNMNFERKEN